MITLFLDLDNTTIYSKRRVSDLTNMVKVEDYKGSPLSYMTKESYSSLWDLEGRKDIQVVPITTRVEYQYNRIFLPEFEYVILGNGATLLYNGTIDAEWKAESESYVDACYSELIKAFNLLCLNYPDTEILRFQEKHFVFGKFEKPNGVVNLLKKSIDTSTVNVFTQGKKVYVLPKEFDKGNSIERLKKRFDAGKIISAGDEFLDFSMKDHSDVFITSNDKCIGDNVIHSKAKIFSDEIFEYVKAELNK